MRGPQVGVGFRVCGGRISLFYIRDSGAIIKDCTTVPGN